MIVRILIADREPLARAHLARLLSVLPRHDVRECSTTRQVADEVSSYKPHLIFLDVDLAEAESLALRPLYASTPAPAIVLTGARQDAAIDLDIQVVDHLLKPFDEERFRKVLARAQAFLGSDEADSLRRQHLRLLSAFPDSGPVSITRSASAPRYVDRLLIHEGDRISFLKVEDIDWIEACGESVQLSVGGKIRRVRENIDALARRLDPRQFLSIHRSLIVNLDRVQELQAAMGSR